MLARVAFAKQRRRTLFFSTLSRCHVEDEGKNRNQLPALVVQHRVVPLAVKNRTFARVIAVASYAPNFYSFALTVCHERYRIDVVSKNKTPLVDVFSEYVVGFPTEEIFGRHRP